MSPSPPVAQDLRNLHDDQSKLTRFSDRLKLQQMEESNSISDWQRLVELRLQDLTLSMHRMSQTLTIALNSSINDVDHMLMDASSLVEQMNAASQEALANASLPTTNDSISVPNSEALASNLLAAKYDDQCQSEGELELAPLQALRDTSLNVRDWTASKEDSGDREGSHPSSSISKWQSSFLHGSSHLMGGYNR
jgi:hypothetical protein